MKQELLEVYIDRDFAFFPWSFGCQLVHLCTLSSGKARFHCVNEVL